MVPLPTLLSQVLVAFTIEADNEFEHRMSHRTALGKQAGAQRGPWLTSLPMWANFLRLIPPGGVPLAQVRGHAAITNLAGLDRWGYIALSPPGGRRAARRARAAGAGGRARAAAVPASGDEPDVRRGPAAGGGLSSS